MLFYYLGYGLIDVHRSIQRTYESIVSIDNITENICFEIDEIKQIIKITLKIQLNIKFID